MVVSRQAPPRQSVPTVQDRRGAAAPHARPCRRPHPRPRPHRPPPPLRRARPHPRRHPPPPACRRPRRPGSWTDRTPRTPGAASRSRRTPRQSEGPRSAHRALLLAGRLAGLPRKNTRAQVRVPPHPDGWRGTASGRYLDVVGRKEQRRARREEEMRSADVHLAPGRGDGGGVCQEAGRQEGREQTITVVAVAPDAGPGLADGELPLDPSLGGRNAVAAIAGARNPLPPPTDGRPGLPNTGADAAAADAYRREGADAVDPYGPSAPCRPCPAWTPGFRPGTELPVAPGPDAEPGLRGARPGGGSAGRAGRPTRVRRSRRSSPAARCRSGASCCARASPTASPSSRRRRSSAAARGRSGSTSMPRMPRRQDRRITITFEAVDRPGAATPPVELKSRPGARATARGLGDRLAAGRPVPGRRPRRRRQRPGPRPLRSHRE